MIDLDNWLSERYRIPGPPAADLPAQDREGDTADNSAKGERD